MALGRPALYYHAGINTALRALAQASGAVYTDVTGPRRGRRPGAAPDPGRVAASARNSARPAGRCQASRAGSGGGFGRSHSGLAPVRELDVLSLLIEELAASGRYDPRRFEAGGVRHRRRPQAGARAVAGQVADRTSFDRIAGKLERIAGDLETRRSRRVAGAGRSTRA